MMPRWIKLLSSVLVIAVAFGLGTAVGQQPSPQAPKSPPAAQPAQPAPNENKGVAIEKTVTQDLGAQIEGMQGRQLRLRTLKIEPGGAIGAHTHRDRPAVDYVVEGTITEHGEHSVMKEHPKGAAFAEGKDTSHWLENKGKIPVVLIIADIVKER
jgi:quercetin dioxygenase-like cupin family protein